MAYALFQADSVTDAIKVLAKKDPVLLKQLGKKLEKLLEDPYGAGKWMHGAYAGVREVHLLGKRFVLFYTIDDVKRVVNLVKFEHHPEKY